MTWVSKACISLGCDSSRQNANGILQNVSKRSRWFSISSRESQDVALVSLEFWTCSKNSCDKFYLKIVTESSRLSRTLLNLVSVSQKVWQMWDNFVRDWRPMKLNCDWLEKKMIICPGTPESATKLRFNREYFRKKLIRNLHNVLSTQFNIYIEIHMLSMQCNVDRFTIVQSRYD